MITIIGSGLAGYTLAREIRKINKEIPLRIITHTDGNFYSKPVLSNALTLKKQVNQLITSPLEKMKESLNAEILTFHDVQKVNAQQKTLDIINLNNKNSYQLSYDKLVFATGANPNTTEFPDVFHINSIEDYKIWHEKLHQDHVKHVGILGGGLIGCEFANDLINAGFQVSLIDSGNTPLGRLLPDIAGEFLKTKLIDAGLNYKNNAKVIDIIKNNKSYDIKIQSKLNQEVTDLSVDLVLGAIGLKPNTILAENAGILINKAIMTNAYLETNIEDHFALGDCAEVENFWLPYVAPIMQSARALAQTLTGTKQSVTYPNMPVIVKTGACPTVIGVANNLPKNQIGFWNWERLDENNLKGLCFNGKNELIGFSLLGKKAISERQQLAGQLEKLI